MFLDELYLVVGLVDSFLWSLWLAPRVTGIVSLFVGMDQYHEDLVFVGTWLAALVSIPFVSLGMALVVGEPKTTH